MERQKSLKVNLNDHLGVLDSEEEIAGKTFVTFQFLVYGKA